MTLPANTFPKTLPEVGLGEQPTQHHIDELIAEYSAPLGDALSFAHMDPPTAPISSFVVGRNAEVNQNLLHPDLSPLASVAERCVINWLAPFFEMRDGHVCSGSTLANLTALWCAREHGAKRVVASSDAHLSVAKAAHILGLAFVSVPADSSGRAELQSMCVQGDCAVLTAGTTSRGVVDVMSEPCKNATWVHIDAAWAGPMRLTQYADVLKGMELADSVAVSSHKWFFQPKDSALVFFKELDASERISFGANYLATPNVGVQGSRGAAGLALLATLLAYGRDGIAERIEKGLQDAQNFAQFVDSHSQLELKQHPETGVVNWRPKNKSVVPLLAKLGSTSSSTKIENEIWIRQVAANPHVNIDAVIDKIQRA